MVGLAGREGEGFSIENAASKKGGGIKCPARFAAGDYEAKRRSVGVKKAPVDGRETSFSGRFGVVELRSRPPFLVDDLEEEVAAVKGDGCECGAVE